MTRRETAAGVACAMLAALCVSAAGCSKPGSKKFAVVERKHTHNADERIREIAFRIVDHPHNYAPYLELAMALLDKTHETNDPTWVTKARAATQTSLDIQETFEGVKMQARIAAFRHRFAEALDFAKKAGVMLSPDARDGALTAIMVEAHLGLGEIDAARALMPYEVADAPDYYSAVALGHWLVATGKVDDAAAAFDRAEVFATREGVKDLAMWARVKAASVYVKAGKLDAARPRLAEAAKLDKGNRELRIAQAEVAAATGQERQALAAYEELLAEGADPELFHRAFLLARKLGDETRAKANFAAAEELLQRAIEGHESYTLEHLARLYVDARVNLGRATELATQNLAIKRDKSAVDVLALAKQAATSPSR